VAPQVGLSAALFAAAHPPGAFLPELLLGAILGAACVAAGGSLLTPLLGHALYNGLIVTAALALAAGGGGGGVGGGGSAVPVP
jgi:membrane protease YdiL (CAAX protease family)